MIRLYVIFSVCILVALNVFDGYSTYVMMNVGVEESNPYMAKLMEWIGILPAILLAKGIFFIILIKACLMAHKKKNIKIHEILTIIGGLTFLNIFYGYFMYTRNLQYLLAFP